MRQMHMKQQQVVNKLIQFLATMVQPTGHKRLGKRQLLAIGPGALHYDYAFIPTRCCRLFFKRRYDDNRVATEEIGVEAKRFRPGNLNAMAAETLDMLQRELRCCQVLRLNTLANACIVYRFRGEPSDRNGPIIADVTDEVEGYSNGTGGLQ